MRQSNTEPLVRLNLEGKDRDVVESKLKQLEDILGKPVDE